MALRTNLITMALSTMASFIILIAFANAAELTKVRAGHLVALDMAPLFVAKESKCFEKHGLDVETIFFANPGDNNTALAGGDIDFSTNPFTLPFFAANGGVPIRVISAAGGWGVMEVVAQGAYDLNSIADLGTYAKAHPKKKLKVGTLQGDTLELILTRSFAENNISIDDVEMVYFNDLLAMVEAFRTERIDVLSHIKPYTSDLILSKGATHLTDNAKAWSLNTPNTVVSVLEDTLDKRPEIVKAYLQGLVCAADIINKNPDQAITLLQNGTYYRVDEDVVKHAFEAAPAPISFVPDTESVQSVVNELRELGYIQGETNVSDIFRLDIMKSLEHEQK